MDKKDLEKRIGFVLPPDTAYEGHFTIYPDKVESVLECKLCGTTIGVLLHGKTDRMSEEEIKRILLLRVNQGHECPAIKSIINSNLPKYYGDILRGSQKYHERKYRIQHGLSRPGGLIGLNGKPFAAA